MSFTDWIHVIGFGFLGIDGTKVDRQDHRHHQQNRPALDQHQRVCRWPPPSPPWTSVAASWQRWWPPRATRSRCHSSTAPPHFLPLTTDLVQFLHCDTQYTIFDGYTSTLTRVVRFVSFKSNLPETVHSGNRFAGSLISDINYTRCWLDWKVSSYPGLPGKVDDWFVRSWPAAAGVRIRLFRFLPNWH